MLDEEDRYYKWRERNILDPENSDGISHTHAVLGITPLHVALCKRKQ